MATVKGIQKFFHMLMELKDKGYTVDVQEGTKNYTSYYIWKSEGNAVYRDCVIVYNGELESKENVCLPEDFPDEELIEGVEKIVSKIDKVFG